MLLTYPSKSIKTEAAKAIKYLVYNRKNLNYINTTVKPLIDLLCDRKGYVRKAAVGVLLTVANHPKCSKENQLAIFSALETLINDRNHDVRNSAIRYLLDIPRQNAFDFFIQELNSSDIWVVEQTIKRLGKMIHSQTITKLEELTLTNAQIDLAIAKLKQVSTNSNRRISKPAQEILAQLKIN